LRKRLDDIQAGTVERGERKQTVDQQQPFLLPAVEATSTHGWEMA
jgi:hypothetical protein